MITLDLPETLEKHFWNIVRDSYQGDLRAAMTAFLELHEKYGWKEQFVKDIKSIREEVRRAGGIKERVIEEGVKTYRAHKQNKVFVERADRPPLSARQAEAKYLLKRGRGNAYIEFDVLPDEVYEQTNHLTGAAEFFLRGNVDLSTRNPQGCDNS
jgi:hypothetical protein